MRLAALFKHARDAKEKKADPKLTPAEYARGVTLEQKMREAPIREGQETEHYVSRTTQNKKVKQFLDSLEQSEKS